tara:strand:+ start:1218 stop:1328 length:111 start_codon:yes stop_codon:yes gene_type:complete
MRRNGTGERGVELTFKGQAKEKIGPRMKERRDRKGI